MLKIWVKGFQKGCIIDPNSFFNLHRGSGWMGREGVKEIVKEIDGLDVISGEALMDRRGVILSPDVLSSGCKSLILLYIKPDCNVYATRCGDNCAKFILDLAEKKDVVITLHHPMLFPRSFEGVFLDNGREIHTLSDYAFGYLDLTRDD